MNNVDNYLLDGCGRCKLYSTPQCKVHNWTNELKRLREIVLSCGLYEEIKWSVPCYTYQNNNILLVSAFKEYCAISFFKGFLLKDDEKILIQQTENTQATRQIRFINIKEIEEIENVVKAYIFEAIEIEKAGLKVKFKKSPEPIPEEFQEKLEEIQALKIAFEKLTPGRQRAYILYFSQPKQSKTRESRIEKYILKIIDGKGLND